MKQIQIVNLTQFLETKVFAANQHLTCGFLYYSKSKIKNEGNKEESLFPLYYSLHREALFKQPGILLQILPFPEELFSLLPQNFSKESSTLFLSSQFHEFYSIKSYQMIFYRLIQPENIFLKYLILQPESKEGFLSSEDANSEMFKKSMIENVPICRTGNPLEIQLVKQNIIAKYQILECRPLHQGIINIDTIIIILESKLTNQSVVIKSKQIEEDLIEHSSFNSPLILASSLLLPDAFPLSTKNNQSRVFNIGMVDSLNYDLELTDIFVTRNTLRQIEIPHKSWVTVQTNNQSEHLVRLLTFDIDYKEEYILFPNYQDELMKSMVSIKLFSFNLDNSAKKALDVHISRVKSPLTDGYTSYVEPLKQYFSHKKLLKKGDIFSVPIYKAFDLISPFELENINKTNKKDGIEYIYFKVTSMKPEEEKSLGLFVDPQETTLVQEGAINSRIPRKIPIIPPGLTENYNQLLSLIDTCLHPFSSSLGVSCFLLIDGPSGCGKSKITQQVANSLGIHLFEKNCYDLLGNSQSEFQTEEELNKVFEEVSNYAPCILLLRNIDALEKTAQQEMNKEPRSIIPNVLRQLFQSLETKNKQIPILVVGTTSSVDVMSGALRSCFRQEIQMQSPSEEQRYLILNQLFHQTPFQKDVSTKQISTLTAGFSCRDLEVLQTHTGSNAIQKYISNNREKELNNRIKQICSIGIQIGWNEIEEGINRVKGKTNSPIKIPKVTWDDVGGLANIKQEILNTIQLPLQHPSSFTEGLQHRSGVLLYGPPGTGKTLLAKAVATECSLNFLSVKGPELINMYVGESEKNVRDLFQRARSARPCVIFFDELDSLAPNRGQGADSGGVMDRIVSQLLTELAGLQKTNDLFVIGATNRPDLIDPALLRPGRFDRLLYLGVSDTHESQLKIIQALTRKFRLSENVNLEKIAEQCPFNLTGADFYALCSDSLLIAMSEKFEFLEKEKVKDEEVSENIIVKVSQDHFEKALRKLKPSVSEEELKHYKQIQSGFVNPNKN